MKVSKNSWHFTLNRYFYGYWYVEQAKSLCPYFWGTILAIVALPIRLTVDGIKALLHLTPETIRRKWNFSKNKGRIIGGIVYCGIAIFDFVILHNWILGLIQIGTAVFFLTNTLRKISDWRFDRWMKKHRHDSIEDIRSHFIKPPKPKKDRKPNMLWEMLKATKNKHCPRLEWLE